MLIELAWTLLADTAVFGVLGLAALVSFQWLNFPDLTPDGSFALAGAVYCVLQPALPTALAVAAALASGAFAGSISAIAGSKWRVQPIISGMAVAGLCYSAAWLVLRSPNRALASSTSALAWLDHLFGRGYWAAGLLSISVVTAILLSCFGISEYGTRLRVLGDNPRLAQRVRISTTTGTVVGLALANGLAALAGVLFVERSYFADVNAGAGITLHGVGALALGTLLGARSERPLVSPSLVLAGALGMRLVVVSGLAMGLPAGAFRGVVGILLLVVFFGVAAGNVAAVRDRVRWS